MIEGQSHSISTKAVDRTQWDSWIDLCEVHNRELEKADFSHVGSSQILMTSQICQNSDVTMGPHYSMLWYSETAVYHVL